MFLERFEMIDRVIDLAAGIVVCRSTVPAASSVFEGHFPSFPVVPGVLLIEIIAQASGCLFLATKGTCRMPFLVGVDQARFKGFVEPENVLTVTARLRYEGFGCCVYAGDLLRGDRLLASAQVRLSVQDFPNEGMRKHVLDRFAAVGALSFSVR